VGRHETLEWFPWKNKLELKNWITSTKTKNKELRWSNLSVTKLDKPIKLVITNWLIRFKQSEWNNR